MADVASRVVLVGPAGEGLAGLVLDLDVGGSLQGVVGEALGGPRSADLPGHHPGVVAVADGAAVGQGDFGQATALVAVGLCAAIGVGVALQLAVGIEALACLEVDLPAAIRLAVLDGAGGRSALRILGVAGLADEAALAVLLCVGGELAVGIVAVADALVGAAAIELVHLAAHAPSLVVGVGTCVAACIGSLGEVACWVVGVLDGAAQGAGFFDELFGFVVGKAVGVALGVGEAGEVVVCVPGLLSFAACGVGGLDEVPQAVVLAEGGFAGRVGAADALAHGIEGLALAQGGGTQLAFDHGLPPALVVAVGFCVGDFFKTTSITLACQIGLAPHLLCRRRI